MGGAASAVFVSYAATFDSRSAGRWLDGITVPGQTASTVVHERLRTEVLYSSRTRCVCMRSEGSS